MKYSSCAGVLLSCLILSLIAVTPMAAQATVSPRDSAVARTDTIVVPDTTKVYQLREIVVTAERVRAVPPPVAVTDVKPEELRKAPARDAYDLLRQTAGIEVHEQGQGPGFASDAVIRGFTSDHSSDVLLVIDGVPINLPIHGHIEGYADWSVLSPAAISSLRVIHGPASPFFGDFAVGGVVEVFTAADAGGPGFAASANSYGDAGGWIRTGARGGEGGWLAAVDGRRQEGWRQNDGYWLGNGLLRGWRAVGGGRLEGGLMLYGSTWNSPGFVSVSRFNSGDVKAPTDTSDGGDARRLIAHARFGKPLSPTVTLESSLWGQLARSTVFLNIPEDGDAHQSDEEDSRQALGGSAQLAWKRGISEVSIGASGRADWTTYQLYHTEHRVREDAEQLNDGRYQAGGLFARWRGLVANRFLYDLGGRLDAIHYQSLDGFVPSEGFRSATHVIASPKVGGRYLVNSKVSLLASLSRGFRGPIGVIAEPERAPTVTWAKEMGVAYRDAGIDAELSLFQQDVSNERILDPITRDVTDAGRSRRRGASVEVGAAVTSRVRLTGEMTLNSAKIKGASSPTLTLGRDDDLSLAAGDPLRPSFHDEPLPPGARVPGVSSYLGRVGADVAALPDLSFRGRIRFAGPYTPIGEPDVRTQPYALAELGATWDLGAIGGALDVDVTNLLDTRYPELRASGFLNPGAPRTLRVGIRFDGAR